MFFADDTVLMSWGFGQIAYLNGDRGLIIHWSFANAPTPTRIISLSKIAYWDAPHNNEELTAAERSELFDRLDQFNKAKNIKAIIC